MTITQQDVAPHQIPLVRFKTQAPNVSLLKANSIIVDSFSVSGKHYLKMVIDGVIKDPIGDLESAIATLKGNPSTDYDSLEKIETKIEGINTLLSSNDINLDTVQEIIDAIKSIETSLGAIIVNDLTTGGTTKSLTAEQGKTLKGLIDTLSGVISALTTSDIAEGSNLYFTEQRAKSAAVVDSLSSSQTAQAPSCSSS